MYNSINQSLNCSNDVKCEEEENQSQSIRYHSNNEYKTSEDSIIRYNPQKHRKHIKHGIKHHRIRKNNKNRNRKRRKKKSRIKIPKIPPISDKKKDLPIITEEDHESDFSASFMPTRYSTSGYWSYHTWGDNNARPPLEDRVVRSGPSIWHWSWDLSFGLYDDIYDNIHHTIKNNSELQNTWLNLEGPLPSWQPLFAAILWFFTSMNILYPVSLISESSPCPSSYNHTDNYLDSIEISSRVHKRIVLLNYSCAHSLIGIIFLSFDIAVWFLTPAICRIILRFGPSWNIFIGLLLMLISSLGMSHMINYRNISYFIGCVLLRILSGIGFCFVRQSSLFLWSHFPKLDMLASGIGFCVGPVLGDLIYTYTSWEVSFIAYASIICLLMTALLFINCCGLLSMKDVSQMDIPEHIVNVRRPRPDLFHFEIRSVSKLYLLFKAELLFITVIALTSLETTIPVYALNPELEISVSGALFTFIYLPLLALSALIGLMFAKSSSKFLSSAKTHVERKRRGMKYITKTVNIDFVGKPGLPTNEPLNGKRFAVKKSEEIKLVESPSWLAKKKRLLPSPDIQQHHCFIILGLFFTSVGFNVLSGRRIETEIVGDSLSVDLILGLVFISLGSAVTIVSCCDSFMNGLAFHTNQVQLAYFSLNFGIIFGPMVGGFTLDLANNELPVVAKYIGLVFICHLVVYVMFTVFKCLVHFCYQYFWIKIKVKIKKRSLIVENETVKETMNSSHTLEKSTSMMSGGRNETIDGQWLENGSLVQPSLIISDDTSSLTSSLISTSSVIDQNKQSLVFEKECLNEEKEEKYNSLKFPKNIRDLSTGKIEPRKRPMSKFEVEPAMNISAILCDSDSCSSSDSQECHSSDSYSDSNENKTDLQSIANESLVNGKSCDYSIDECKPLSFNANNAMMMKDRWRQRRKIERRKIKVLYVDKKIERFPVSHHSRIKRKQPSIAKVYLYGKNLRHLCWWKRGLNVRFPYIQWLSSGWSATRVPRRIDSAVHDFF